MPLILLVVLVPIALIALTPLMLIQRYRVGTSRRPARRWMAMLAAVALGWSIGVVSESAGQTATKPNVVFLFADDLGYGDLGCFGQQNYKTPNLDKLAADGTRFTSFYVAQPVCTASRASLMTGSIVLADGGYSCW